MKKINFKRIDLNNIELACNIQNEIFPIEDARENYIEQLEETTDKKEQKYYIVYAGEQPIGVTGIYSYYEYPNDAWLGWFGILEKYRNNGYGGLVLDETIEMAKQKGYKTFRLYTDEDAKDAHRLYESRELKKELYDNPLDKDQYIDAEIFIYSKSLTNKETTLWNNKTLGLKEQSEKEHLFDKK